jgi:hypothetical protein
MSIFPQVIEEIIMDYKYQMDHKEKFQSTVQAINKINYTTGTFHDGELYLTTRELPSESYMDMNHIEYYHQPYAERKNRLMIEAHYCFRGDSVIYSKSIETTNDGFVKVSNQGVAYD